MKNITFQSDDSGKRADGSVIVASGKTTRNRDWWTGKPYTLNPAGMRLDAWRRNPQMLYGHSFSVPLGTADMFHENGMLIANNLQFHRKTVPVIIEGWSAAIGEFNTAVIADLWEEGWLHATSVHIHMDNTDLAAIIEREDDIYVPVSEVIEFSPVVMPADSHAVKQRMMAFGLNDKLADWATSSQGIFAPQTALGSIAGERQPAINVLSPSTKELPSMSTPDILDVGRGARVSLNLAAQADDDAIIEEEVVEVEEEVIEEEVAEEAEVEEAEVELHIEQETVIDIPVDELASHLLTLPGFIQQVADLVAQSIGAGQQQAASAPQIRFVRSQPQRPTIAANLNGAAAPARPAKKAEPEAPAKKNTVSGFVITSV